MIIYFLLFLSFLLMYQFNRTTYYCYSLFFPWVIFFLLNKLEYSLAYTVVNAQYFAIVAIALFWRQFKKKAKFYLTYITIYLAYFLFDSALQGVSFLTRWNTYKTSLIFMIWGSMLIEDIRNRKVSVIRLRRFFVGFIVFEVLLGALQNTFEPIRDFFREVNYKIQGEVVEIRDIAIGGFMRGTFRGVSTYANILCDCFAVCAISFFYKGKLTIQNLILLFSTLTIILFAGIRISLLLSLIILIVLMIRYKQKKAIVITFTTMITVFFIIGYSLDYIQDVRTVSFEEGGAIRSLSVFQSIQGNKIEEETTFSLTLNMIPYVLKNPMFGIGIHDQGGYELTQWGKTLEEFSYSDAMLSFTIAEIGIIGLIIYLWPLWRHIKWSVDIGANKFNYVLLFIFMILTTIIDIGLMTYNYLLIFFFAVVFFIEKPATKNTQKKQPL